MKIYEIEIVEERGRIYVTKFGSMNNRKEITSEFFDIIIKLFLGRETILKHGGSMFKIIMTKMTGEEKEEHEKRKEEKSKQITNFLNTFTNRYSSYIPNVWERR